MQTCATIMAYEGGLKIEEVRWEKRTKYSSRLAELK